MALNWQLAPNQPKPMEEFTSGARSSERICAGRRVQAKGARAGRLAMIDAAQAAQVGLSRR